MIIRNPFDAMVADYQRYRGRRTNGDERINGSHHTDTVDASYFGECMLECDKTVSAVKCKEFA